MLIYCESDHLDFVGELIGVNSSVLWLCKTLLLRLNPSNALHFRSARHTHGIGVDGGVLGNGKEWRPLLVGRQNGGRHLSLIWLSRPSSAEVVGDGGWESQVEQMIMVAKEAGRWCWVIVAHFGRSVSVCQSNYHNQRCIARYGKKLMMSSDVE